MTALKTPSYSLLTDFLLSHLVALAILFFMAGAWFLFTDPSSDAVEPITGADAVVQDQKPVVNVEPVASLEQEPVVSEPVPAVVEVVVHPIASTVEENVANTVSDSVAETVEPVHVTIDDAVSEPVPLSASTTAVVGGDEAAYREELLQQARKAFWAGSLDVSEAAYLKYLKQFPEDANVFGELGNLYQSMGNPQAALNAYVEAAFRLQLQGEYQQLQQIVDLLYKAGDPRAEQFRVPVYNDNSQEN